MAAIHENLARGEPVRGASNRAFGGVFVAVKSGARHWLDAILILFVRSGRNCTPSW